MASKRNRRTTNNLSSRLNEYNEHLLAVRQERKQLVNNVFNIYLDESTREGLLEDLERTKFSKEKTQKIKEVFENYNTDVLDINIVKTIVAAEKHVNERTKEEGFFSAIGNIFNPRK